jgi:hypothetical protein
VLCEPSCIKWTSYQLCSHAIAVAEKEGILRSFILDYAKDNKGPTMTNLATQDMPKGHGKKATKVTQRRKVEEARAEEWYV